MDELGKNMMHGVKVLGIPVASATLLMACGNNDGIATSTAPESTVETPGRQLPPAMDWADADAGFIGADGTEMGQAAFKNAPVGGVLIRVELQGLDQGWHGIHLHQIGDCSDGADGFKASGSHINPHGREHGLLNPSGPERADLPNLYAGADGRVAAEIFASGLSLTVGAEGPVENGLYKLIDEDGFAVIVHENADDHLTQPIGGAGGRVVCAAVLPE